MGGEDFNGFMASIELCLQLGLAGGDLINAHDRHDVSVVGVFKDLNDTLAVCVGKGPTEDADDGARPRTSVESVVFKILERKRERKRERERERERIRRKKITRDAD